MFEAKCNNDNNNHPLIAPIDLITEAAANLEAAGIPYRTGPGFIAYDANGTGGRVPLDYTNLNGVARDAAGKKIWCRHLAYFMMDGPINRRKLAALQSKESIEQIDMLRENKFDKEKAEQRGKHYCIADVSQFGDALFELSYNVNDNNYHNFLLSTKNHMLALSITREDDYFIVKFFDPNISTKYIKAFCLNRESLKKITIDVFLSKDNARKYKINTLPIAFISYQDVWDSNLSIKTDNTAYLISYLLQHGLADQLRHFLSTHRTTLSISDWLTIANNKWGLNLALIQGHTMAVGVYLEYLLMSPLTLLQKQTIILHDLPSLLISLRKEHRETVYMFIDKILVNPNNSSTLIALMLNIYRYNNNIWLCVKDKTIEHIHHACKRGDTDSVKSYLDIILNSCLAQEKEIALVQDSLSGLKTAFKHNHIATANVFINTILASHQLISVFIKPILSHYQHQPTPLAHILNCMFDATQSAFKKGDAISVTVYLDKLIYSALSADQKGQWLQRCIPHLLVANATRRTRIVDSFIDRALTRKLNTDSAMILPVLIASRPYPTLWKQIKKAIVARIEQQPTRKAQQDLAETFKIAINLQRKPHALSQMSLFKTNTQKQIQTLIEQSTLPTDSVQPSWMISAG